ncbi:arginine--tRNA ligase [uncultured Algimonas sp.]|uniref:arginine--tRNA ligase n=1 Tax=uncultured Algimonas sp. TaxID=1547920 RepID=UPI002634EE5F|nr:arginine--tRNA ligase [uncultured Algimonas sp.]
MPLQDRLSDAFGEAFAALGHESALGAVVENLKGDAPFQCNGAMAAAGAAKKRGEKANPREIATAVAARLSDHPLIKAIDIGGPGFLNIVPSSEALTETAQAIMEGPVSGLKAGAELTIVIDYGGANVAKPMHVGHLRSAVIGEAIKRLMRARGHTVIGDAHLGDWGLQMGHLISELESEQPGLVYFDPDYDGNYPDEPPVTMDDLGRLYPQASNAAKSDKARMERSRVATAELQAGRRGYRALLDHFIAVSVAVLKEGYGALGVEFDLWNGEMCVDPLIPGMIEDLDAQGLTREDDGALIIDVDPDYDQDKRKGTPPLMVKARTGAVLYATTDLATLIDRKREIDPDLLLYVVDQRQANHFEQVFRAAARAGWFERDQMEHLGFGTMNGKDGKPFKTRDGGVLRLEDLLETMRQAAEARLAESGMGAGFDDEERADIARLVGLAALKFADLQNARLTNYVFDPERFTAFEGKTGPYLLYAAVRIKSILRKAEAAGAEFGPVSPDHEDEASLVLALDAYPKAVALAAEKRAPHILCDHVYGLAQTFSRFYTHCPILADDVSPEVKGARLSLAKATLEQLEHGLDILGIEVPERM